MRAEFPSDDTGQRLASGKWQIQIDEVTWQMLHKARRPGESVSDCIIRVIIIIQHKRGLL
ncbi:putative CopG family antitoxin [Bradyrhizobium sp. i1.7.7]